MAGLLSEPGGVKLTTPTEVKAATELMMVGMMLNLPACRHKDQGERVERVRHEVLRPETRNGDSQPESPWGGGFLVEPDHGTGEEASGVTS